MPKSIMKHFTISSKSVRPLVRLDINTSDNYLFLTIPVLSKYREKVTAEEPCTILHGDRFGFSIVIHLEHFVNFSLYTMTCHGMYLLKLYLNMKNTK